MRKRGWLMSISCTSSYKSLLGCSALMVCILATPAGAQQSQVVVPVASAPVAKTLPAELIYNGQPVDAKCFEDMSADEWLDVAACVPPEITKLPDPAGEWANGKIGYNYRYKEDMSDAVSYSYYDYIGLWNAAPVILSYSSGGGTGQFTSLASVERVANKIRVLQGFGAGDRCNGGVVDAKIEYGVLYYGQNMTPIDFLQMAEDNPHDLQPYDDLEASASSCFGIARFRDEKFVGVTLLDMPESQPAAGTTYKYQDCFNKLFRAKLAKGEKELSVNELKEFTGEFNQVCLLDDQPR